MKVKISENTSEYIWIDFYPLSSQGLRRPLIFKWPQQLLICAPCVSSNSPSVSALQLRSQVSVSGTSWSKTSLQTWSPASGRIFASLPRYTPNTSPTMLPTHASHDALVATASCGQTSFLEVRTHFPASNAIIDFWWFWTLLFTSRN